MVRLIKPVDRADQAIGLNCPLQLYSTAAQMLRQKAVANIADALAMCVIPRKHRDIAFSIEPHRSPVEIGRADPQQSVVDDCDLGMHIDRLTAIIHRLEDTETVISIRSLHALHHPPARDMHRLIFNLALGTLGVDDDDLGAV